MSELTAALETIFSWLKANYPKLEQSYQPGLSYEEIKSYDDKLGDYYFTSEFYELYQWRNGTLAYPEEEIILIDGDFYDFDDCGYLTLLNDRTSQDKKDAIEPFLVLYWLPIQNVSFCKYEDGCRQFSVLSPFLVRSYYKGDFLVCPVKTKENMSSLLYAETQYVYGEVYPSLTAKFLDLVDSIESNAYLIKNTEYGNIMSVDTSRIVSKRQLNISEDDFFDPGDGTAFETLAFL